MTAVFWLILIELLCPLSGTEQPVWVGMSDLSEKPKFSIALKAGVVITDIAVC